MNDPSTLGNLTNAELRQYVHELRNNTKELLVQSGERMRNLEQENAELRRQLARQQCACCVIS